MITNRFFLHIRVLAVVTASVLYTTSLRAQTFKGQAKLSELPKGMEALIYPSETHPSAIRVNFNNPMGGSVRIIVRDTKGHIFYDELTEVTRYRKRLFLSSLPAGNYSVEVSSQTDQFAELFTVEPPKRGRITMKNKKEYAPVADKGLMIDN